VPIIVAVELPEKQGLKPKPMEDRVERIIICCSGTSRKTRIETPCLLLKGGANMRCCSGTSRKTRIETTNPLKVIFVYVIPVAVELPEKQGLKPFLKRCCCCWFAGCSGTSRKTRIETNTA